MAVALALTVAVLGSGANWLAIGYTCNDKEHVRESDQFVVCEVEWGQHRQYREGRVIGSATDPVAGVAAAFVLLLPILLVLGGAIISVRQRRPKPFWISVMLAAILLVLPWLGLLLTS
jgi:hypothetical protein